MKEETTYDTIHWLTGTFAFALAGYWFGWKLFIVLALLFLAIGADRQRDFVRMGLWRHK